MHHLTHRSRRRAHGFIIVALLLLFAPPWTTLLHAQALDERVPRGEIPRPIRLDELDELTHLVNLSPEQRRAIDHLHERYVAAYRPERRQRWQRMDDLLMSAQSPDPVVAAALRRETRSAREWAKQAHEQFLASVLDILTPEQRTREEAIRLRHRRARCDLSVFQIPASHWQPMVPDLFLLLFTAPVREQVPEQAFELWLEYERRAVEAAERAEEWMATRTANSIETGGADQYGHAGMQRTQRSGDVGAVPHAVACVRSIADLLDDPIDRGMVYRAVMRIFHLQNDSDRIRVYPLMLDPWTASDVRRDALDAMSPDDAESCMTAINEANAQQIDAIDQFLRMLSDTAVRAASDPNQPNVHRVWSGEFRPFQARLGGIWTGVRDACGPAYERTVGSPLQWIDRKVWAIRVDGMGRETHMRSWPTGSATGSISLRWMQRLLAANDETATALEAAFDAHESAWQAHPALQVSMPGELFGPRFPGITESTEEDDRAQVTDLDRRRRAAVAAARELDQRWFRSLRGITDLDGESRDLLDMLERALTAERLTRWSFRTSIGQQERLICTMPLQIIVESGLDREHTLITLRLLLENPRELLDRAEAFSAAQLDIVSDQDNGSVIFREDQRSGTRSGPPSREQQLQRRRFRTDLLNTETAARLTWIRKVQETLTGTPGEQFTATVHRVWFPELDRSDRRLEQVLEAVLDNERIDAPRRREVQDLVLAYRSADSQSRQDLKEVVFDWFDRSGDGRSTSVLDAAYAEQLIHHWEMRRRVVDRLRELLTEAEAQAAGLNPRQNRSGIGSVDIGMPREIVYPPMR